MRDVYHWFVHASSERLRNSSAGLNSTIPGTWVLYAIFFGTGISLVLPGAMLPLLVAKWGLLDPKAGALLFLLFIGTVLGAVLSRGALPASIARGCIVTALGASFLTVRSSPGAFAAMFLYGVGLGMAMTSISLLQARRHPLNSRAEMARLNLTWSMGACVGPWLALHGAIRFSVSGVLFTIAAFFVLCSLLAQVFVFRLNTAALVRPRIDSRGFPLSWVLLSMVALSTGIEAATGGWLTVYSERFGLKLGTVIGAVTCFWCGMFASRFAQSYQRCSVVLSRHFVVFGPALMCLGLSTILSRRGSGIPLGATLLGLGVGPMYPLLLASVLERGESRNLVFVMAGLGSSLLPFVTGIVSGKFNSIRAGIGISLAGAFLLAVLGHALRRSTLIVSSQGELS